MAITLDLLVLIVGLLMYAPATNGKLVEIGRIMFFCDLFCLLLGSDKVVALFK